MVEEVEGVWENLMKIESYNDIELDRYYYPDVL